MTTTETTLRYAVIPSHGCYGSGSKVHPVSRHRTIEAAEKKAAKATREYQDAMRRHGGSSGGYRVVEWPHGEQWVWGHDADRMETVSA